MKKSLVLFVLFLICHAAYSQQPSAQKIKNTTLTYVLNNIRSTHKAETRDCNVTIFVVSNKSGSAKRPESHEVTDNIYIAVSEFDEYPKQTLFVIKDLYAPSGIQLTRQDNQSIQLTFSYIQGEEKKKYTCSIKLDAVEQLNTK